MANIKFGIPQINLPTPAGINLWVRAFTIVSAILMAWMPTNNIVPSHTQDIIVSILSLLTLISNGLAPLFGVQVQGGAIAAKDVTAVKEDPMFLNKFDAAAPNDIEQQHTKKGL